MIKIKNLFVYMKDTPLLKDVNFALNESESLGIIGKSGCGKSTLAKAIVNIFDNDRFYKEGEISIYNHAFENNMRGNMISLMFQNPNTYLNPTMKIGKQISEMLIYHKQYNKQLAKEKTLSFMNKIGLDSKYYNYYPFELSGGLQQKVCLCISLICEPKILILDESTSYLDHENKELILHLIKTLQKEYKFTLIMISHDFKEIYNYCDKIAVMKDGEIIEFGKKNEIILNPYHPHTIELLALYLSYFKDIDYPILNSNLNEESSLINIISDSHYFKGVANKQIKSNYSKIKEAVYENLNN